MNESQNDTEINTFIVSDENQDILTGLPLISLAQTDIPSDKSKTNRFSRLLLPHERAHSKSSTDEPTKPKRTYKKLGAEDKRMIAFGKSIIQSISANDTRKELVELENEIFNDDDKLLNEDVSPSDTTLLQNAYNRSYIKHHASTTQIKENHEHMVNVDSDVWNVPEENLFSILAGEQPLPVPRKNFWAFRAIQEQLDNYIVNTLPKEFWGSCFYMDSNTQLIRNRAIPTRETKQIKEDMQIIDSLTSIANNEKIDILKFYNNRISKKRARELLDSLSRKYANTIDDTILDRAKERMKSITEDLSKKKKHRYVSPIKQL